MIGDDIPAMNERSEKRSERSSKNFSLSKTAKGGLLRGLMGFVFKQIAKVDKKGVTLMELLVVLGVFTMTTSMSTAIFLQANQVQRRVLAITSAQADLRFALEAMVREVRSGGIDYAFYENTMGGVPIPSDILVATNPFGQREEFFVEHSSTVCPEPVQNCIALSLDGSAPQPLTSRSIDIEQLVFYISPSLDPFILDKASGQYKSDLQPTVTIYIKGRTTNPKVDENVSLSAQTTVTVRSYVR